ncbi:MAG TPA: FadR/GntR family transcriptional regulator [Alphaproteobacteria bacterium]|nr:FadR/GntR family transcriptional regulator [Alphaproteobacteria bacterium]
MPLHAIASQRLYQQVADQLGALIRNGEYLPGARLPPERDLARQLGVSRPVVREAMVALELAGLVEVRTGSGTYVQERGKARPPGDSGPGPFELLGARRLIEGEIAALAAREAAADALDAVRDAVGRLERGIAAGADSRADDRLFHARIAAATGNGVLTAIVEDLWDGMFQPLFEALSHHAGLPEHDRMTLADHRAILDRLEARDPSGARAAMHAHLDHVAAILARADDIAEV